MNSLEYEDACFAAAIQQASKPNYLGSPTVIDRILVDLWNGVFSRWSGGVEDVDAALKVDGDACDRAAKIFLGMDSGFAVMPAWNRPGGIDQHVAEVMDIAEKDPVTRISYLLLAYLTEIWGIVGAAKEGGIKADPFQAQGADVIQKYRYILMGLIQPTENGCELTARDEDDDQDSV